MGFEPMKEFPLYTLSKRAPSTTRPPLLNIISYYHKHYLIKTNNLIIENNIQDQHVQCDNNLN